MIKTPIRIELIRPCELGVVNFTENATGNLPMHAVYWIRSERTRGTATVHVFPQFFIHKGGGDFASIGRIRVP